MLKLYIKPCMSTSTTVHPSPVRQPLPPIVLSVVCETKEKGRERRCKRQCPSSFGNSQNSFRSGFYFLLQRAISRFFACDQKLWRMTKITTKRSSYNTSKESFS